MYFMLFKYLEEAFISTLEEILKNEINEPVKQVFIKFFSFLSSNIIQGIKNAEEKKKEDDLSFER